MIDTSFVFEQTKRKPKPSTREFKGSSLLELIDNFVVVDIETTGFSPQYDKIIEISAIRYKNNQFIAKFSELIEIDTKLPPFITEFTGITDKMLEGQKNIQTVIKEFDNFLEDSIILAHNANFDVNFLYDNYMRYLEKPLKNDFLDTMRLAKKLIKDVGSYKLGVLANYFGVEYIGAHRALRDVEITFEIYNKLREYANKYYDIKMQEIEKTLILDKDFKNSKVAVKTSLKHIDYKIIKNILNRLNCKTYDIFYSSSDFLIVNDATFKKYLNKKFSQYDEYFSNWLIRADMLEKEGRLKVISEIDFCKKFGIPVVIRENKVRNSKFSAKDITPTVGELDETHQLFDKVCVFTGTLDKLVRKDAMQIVVNLGGVCGDNVTSKTNYLILGNTNYYKTIKDGKTSKQKKAENLKLKGQDIEIITENDFYDIIRDE